MNKYVKLTQYLLVALFFAMVAYDFWAIAVGGKDASISQVIIDYSYQYPIGVFSLGIIMGHLFWRMPDRYKISKEEYEIVLKHRKK